MKNEKYFDNDIFNFFWLSCAMARKNMTPMCQSLSACSQFTSQQSNEMIRREWNLIPQPFFKCTIPSTKEGDIFVFYNGHSTYKTTLATLLDRISIIASDLAITWSGDPDPATFGQLLGDRFDLGGGQPCNAWVFRHDAETGFVIVPMLTIIQPAMALVDLVVPIGHRVTECCGEPLEIRFFPKVISHNVLWQLLHVLPDRLPEIIGVDCKATCNTLVNQLLHKPTWENIVRIGIVAVQQLADLRCPADLCESTSPCVTPIDIKELVEESDDTDIGNRTHPHLFQIIRCGQAGATREARKTNFTASVIFDLTSEAVSPVLSNSIIAQMTCDVPMHKTSAYANAAMDAFFFMLNQPEPMLETQTTPLNRKEDWLGSAFPAPQVQSVEPEAM